MRSVHDLTAAARVRESAMRLFAERGVAAVTIRDVAADAGVSPALVIHHYKSKDGLKAAVDERAALLVAELFALAEDPGVIDAPEAALGTTARLLSSQPALFAYLRRLLVDGGAGAEMLFRTLYEATHAALEGMHAAGRLRPGPDTAVRAAFLLVNDLGALILREQIASVVGVDPLAPDGMQRWGETVLDVYGHGMFTTPEEGL